MTITPNVEQFVELAESDLEGEVVMLNLLKYKERATDADPEGGTGEDAYGRYAERAVAMVEERGGRVLWMGTPRHVLIGDPTADDWDAVALVSYPNRQAFIDMVNAPAYQDAHAHREAGLDRTVLIACAPRTDRLRDA